MAEKGFSLAPSCPLRSYSPPGFVQAPSKLTTLRWWPIWMRIFSSDIRALCSLWVAPSAEVKQHRSGASQTESFSLPLCSLLLFFQPIWEVLLVGSLGRLCCRTLMKARHVHDRVGFALLLNIFWSLPRAVHQKRDRNNPDQQTSFFLQTFWAVRPSQPRRARNIVP